VTESEDWVKEFQRKETQKASSVGEGDEISNSGSHGKKCGTHKLIEEYLKHWYQLCKLVQGRHAKREISESWYDSWREFACEEITLKKNKDVLPKFEDVFGGGKTQGRFSSGIVLDTDLQLCTQTSEVYMVRLSLFPFLFKDGKFLLTSIIIISK
jgi:hypothetical protein